jgi:hypothetical protein
MYEVGRCAVLARLDGRVDERLCEVDGGVSGVVVVVGVVG